MGLTQATTAYSGSALPCRARGNSRARKAETLASVDRSPVTRGVPTARRPTSSCALRSAMPEQLRTTTPNQFGGPVDGRSGWTVSCRSRGCACQTTWRDESAGVNMGDHSHLPLS
jgi:hypothetical protein